MVFLGVIPFLLPAEHQQVLVGIETETRSTPRTVGEGLLGLDHDACSTKHGKLYLALCLEGNQKGGGPAGLPRFGLFGPTSAFEASPAVEGAGSNRCTPADPKTPPFLELGSMFICMGVNLLDNV